MGDNRYVQPWEYVADVFGGTQRNHSPEAVQNGRDYWNIVRVISLLFWIVGSVMKKVILLLCLLFLSGCTHQAAPYPFPNQGEDISHVDLVYNYNPSGEGTNRDFFHGENFG